MRGDADTWIGLIWLLSAHRQQVDRMRVYYHDWKLDGETKRLLLLPARARQHADRMRTE